MTNPFDEIQKSIDEIKCLLNKAIDHKSIGQNNKPTNRLLKFEEACDFLQVAPSTLYKYVSDRKIVFCKSGKHLRFWENDLIDFINRGKHKAFK